MLNKTYLSKCASAFYGGSVMSAVQLLHDGMDSEPTSDYSGPIHVQRQSALPNRNRCDSIGTRTDTC